MSNILKGLIWTFLGLWIILLMFILFSNFIREDQSSHEVSDEIQEEIDNIIMPTFTKSEIPDEVYRRIYGKSYKDNPTIKLEDLSYLTLTYYDYDGKKHLGEMIVNNKVADDVLAIFKDLYSVKYPIYSIKLVDEFDGSDFDSCEANNTSAFNYRYVDGTATLSNHATGFAIDINPVQNPCVDNGTVDHENAKTYINRSTSELGMIMPDDECVKAFKERGWEWGGDWINPKDYQHFEKVIEEKK